MTEFASRWSLAMYHWKATSSTCSFSLGGELWNCYFLLEEPLRQQLKKQLREVIALHTSTLSTAQLHCLKFFFKPSIKDKKIHQEYYRSYKYGKLLSLWEEGRTRWDNHSTDGSQGPYASNRQWTSTLSHEQKFLPVSMQLLPKLSEW